MHQKHAVADLSEFDALDLAHRRHDLIGVVATSSGDREVGAQPLGAGLGDVHGRDHATLPLDRAGDFAHGGDPSGQLQPHGDRVGHGRYGAHGVIVTHRVVRMRQLAGIAWGSRGFTHP